MGNISFTPKGLRQEFSYYAELLYDSQVVHTEYDLVNYQPYTFEVEIPGSYTIKVARVDNDLCVLNITVQALFPIVEFDESAVDCTNNTYSFFLTLTNPATAGINVQYGWSLLNDCATVQNWSSSTNLILPADDVVRYVFVRNQDQLCCNFVTGSVQSPCDVCNLDVINVVFTCN
jgi:hypothetical protein